MLETDTLLEKCPRCGAWPMAANLERTVSAQPAIRFRCPRAMDRRLADCGAQPSCATGCDVDAA